MTFDISAENKLKLDLIPIGNFLNSQLTNQNHSVTLQQIAEWCADYLCTPNPEINSEKAVCPWSPVAMKRETFWLEEVITKGRSNTEIINLIHSALALFKEKRPHYGNKTQFKTIVLAFPDLYPEDKVEFFQERLKPYFMAEGLMLGEFYPSCETGGLRSSETRPLRSPIPLLVVREMLVFDIAFIGKGKDKKNYKKYVNYYFDWHGREGYKKAQSIINNQGEGFLNKSQVEKLEEILKERENHASLS